MTQYRRATDTETDNAIANANAARNIAMHFRMIFPLASVATQPSCLSSTILVNVWRSSETSQSDNIQLLRYLFCSSVRPDHTV